MDQPPSDVYVVIAPSADGSQRRDLYHMTTTDYRGHFRLTGLNPGEFLLFAVDEDPVETDLLDPEFIHTHESLGKSAQLKEGDHQSVELKLVPPSNRVLIESALSLVPRGVAVLPFLPSTPPTL